MSSCATDYLEGLQNGKLNGDEIEKVLEAGFLKNAKIENINGASIDLRMSDEIKYMSKDYEKEPVSINNPGNLFCETEKLCPYSLVPPQAKFLSSSIESFNFPDYLVGSICTRSSVGRLFLDHQESGWIDPGFYGDLTLEFVNDSNFYYKVSKGDRLVQLIIEKITPVSKKYSYRKKGRYNGAIGLEESKGV